MKDMAQRRQPKGASDGGQFAETKRTDSDVTLVSEMLYNGKTGEIIDPDTSNVVEFSRDDVNLHRFREDETYRSMVLDTIARPFDPNGHPDRWRMAYDSVSGMLVRSQDLYVVDTNETSMNPATSDNPDVRMWAAWAKGDIVFENRLLSEAMDLNSHGVKSETPRFIELPSEIRHNVTSSSDRMRVQAAFIDGYAAAASSVKDLRERFGYGWTQHALNDRGWNFSGVELSDDDPDRETMMKYRRVGWGRAVFVENVYDALNAGAVNRVKINRSYSSNSAMQVDVYNIDAAGDGYGYIGRTSAEPGEGALVWFAADSVIDWE